MRALRSEGTLQKARDGLIKQFTGIDAPYEAPENPEIIIDTANNDVQTCVKQVLEYIENKVSTEVDTNGSNKEKSFASIRSVSA